MRHARIYKDRTTAGIALARQLKRYSLEPPLLVLGLPRGGVPVAYEIACALRAPLDVLVVRKVGMPHQPELAMGAVASGNITVNESAIVGDSPELRRLFERLATNQRRELERREQLYRSGQPPLDLRGKTIILVDDGLATGSTMLAAVRAARKAGARKIIVAAPVAAPEARDLVRSEVEESCFLQVPPRLFAVGQWYENFEQIEDSEVCRLLLLSRDNANPTGQDQFMSAARS